MAEVEFQVLSPGARIAVVGAGISGLVSARTLGEFGFRVTVFDRTPDVGGVWSVIRRYPGLRTQNSKHTYRFSDHPMPASYPDWPTGRQMQQYLEGYAKRFHVDRCLRLGVEVEWAEPQGTGWELSIRNLADGRVELQRFDHVVVANGIFCNPSVPLYTGVDVFQAAGGVVAHTSQFPTVGRVDGRHVVVVGFGKSACDVAAAMADSAASVHVVARRLLWKMPCRISFVGSNERVSLTRIGEASFPHLEPTRLDRFLRGPGRPLRDAAFRRIEGGVRRRLAGLDLVPDGRFEEIAQSSVSLETDGFVSKVLAGSIRVHRDTEISELFIENDVPHVRLSNGQTIRADLVLCATGFHQRVAFLPADLQRRLVDERGDLLLYRHIHPLDVPRLSFVGYNSSLISALNAEVAALWVAAQVTGRLVLPPVAKQRADVARRLTWMDERTQGHSAHGTSVVPFSIRNLDEMLADLGVRINVLARAREYVAPIDPTAYRHLRRAILARQPLPSRGPAVLGAG